ncbi:MAG: UrcA family protein [Sphingomonas sp.]
MTKTIITIAALATVLAAAPALATDPAQKTASIRTGDLDLSRPGDLRILDRRVAAAKEAVCGSYAGARDGAEDRIAACRANVDRQLEPQLAALRAKSQLALR